MRDLCHPFWIKCKGVLFLCLGLFAGTLLLVDTPTWRAAALLALTVWGFCRAYYFAFYVIEHYVDPGHKFSGLGAFLQYCWRKRSK